MKIFKDKSITKQSNIPKRLSIDEKLENIRKEINKKKNTVAASSEEVANLKNELSIFEVKYHQEVGILYIRIDELELEINEYLKRIELLRNKEVKDFVDLETKIKEYFSSDYKKVQDEKDEAEQYTQQHKAFEDRPKLDDKTKKRIKSLYRELAKTYHPDMASSPEEAERFHKVMADINQAYYDFDIGRLEELSIKLKISEKVFTKEGEEEYKRLQKENERLDAIISSLRAEFSALQNTDTYKLKIKVDEAQKKGKLLLSVMANDLQFKIQEKEKYLETIKQEFKSLAQELV